MSLNLLPTNSIGVDSVGCASLSFVVIERHEVPLRLSAAPWSLCTPILRHPNDKWCRNGYISGVRVREKVEVALKDDELIYWTVLSSVVHCGTLRCDVLWYSVV